MGYVVQNGIARTGYRLSNSRSNLAAVFNRRYNSSCLVVNLGTPRRNVKKFYIPPRQCIYVFCVVTRINRFHLPIQLKLIGFATEMEVFNAEFTR